MLYYEQIVFQLLNYLNQMNLITKQLNPVTNQTITIPQTKINFHQKIVQLNHTYLVPMCQALNLVTRKKQLCRQVF